MTDPTPHDGYRTMSDDRLMELYDDARTDLGRTMARYAASGVPARASREAGLRVEYITRDLETISAEMERRGLSGPRWVPDVDYLKNAARRGYRAKVKSSPPPAGVDDEEDGTA